MTSLGGLPEGKKRKMSDNRLSDEMALDTLSMKLKEEARKELRPARSVHRANAEEILLRGKQEKYKRSRSEGSSASRDNSRMRLDDGSDRHGTETRRIRRESSMGSQKGVSRNSSLDSWRGDSMDSDFDSPIRPFRMASNSEMQSPPRPYLNSNRYGSHSLDRQYSLDHNDSMRDRSPLRPHIENDLRRLTLSPNTVSPPPNHPDPSYQEPAHLRGKEGENPILPPQYPSEGSGGDRKRLEESVVPLTPQITKEVKAVKSTIQKVVKGIANAINEHNKDNENGGQMRERVSEYEKGENGERELKEGIELDNDSYEGEDDNENDDKIIQRESEEIFDGIGEDISNIVRTRMRKISEEGEENYDDSEIQRANRHADAMEQMVDTIKNQCQEIQETRQEAEELKQLREEDDLRHQEEIRKIREQFEIEKESLLRLREEDQAIYEKENMELQRQIKIVTGEKEIEGKNFRETKTTAEKLG